MKRNLKYKPRWRYAITMLIDGGGSSAYEPQVVPVTYVDSALQPIQTQPDTEEPIIISKPLKPVDLTLQEEPTPVAPVTYVDPALQPVQTQAAPTQSTSTQTVTSGTWLKPTPTQPIQPPAWYKPNIPETPSQPTPTTETEYPVEQLSKDKNSMFIASGVGILGLLFLITQ